MTIGILGGGQLGYMLALAGYPLGLHFRFLDPSPEAPVGRIAHRVTAEFSDEQALEKFASGLEVVTYEFENVPVQATRFLAGRVPVYPPAAALEEAHDGAERLKLREVCLDVRGMCFLSSESIKNVAKLVLRAQTTGYTVRFLVDGGLPWQARAVAPLRRLSPGTVVIESVLG